MHDDNDAISPWMFRKKGETFSLFLSLGILIIFGYIFSLIDFWVVIFLLLGVVVYVQLEQARYLGNSMRVHSNQFPEINEIFINCAKKLNISKANLYITQDPTLNAHAIGLNTCSVVLSSALVEQFDSRELEFVIAHELGHFKAGHTKISSLFIPLDFGNMFSSLIFGIWQRKSEYSADQCGLVVTKKLEPAINAILKITVGGKLFEKLNVDGFIAQMKKADNFSVKLGELLGSHPVATNRVKNLVEFWKKNFKLYEM